MPKISIILIALLFLILSCEKDEEKTVFSGITETKANGEVISTDKKDWNLMENWSQKEAALFSEQYADFCESTINEYSILAYPNPCTDIITLNFEKPEDGRILFSIVDEDYNIIVSEETTFSSVSINFSQLNINNKIIRVYYKFIGENCELKGHGDIKVN